MSRKFVTIEGRALAPVLKRMMLVTERRTSAPVLGMVMLKVGGSQLTVSATDLDIELSTRLDVIDAGGLWAVCVSPYVLYDIARMAGPAPLVMTLLPGGGLGITVDQVASYELVGLPATSYPTFGSVRGELLERFTNGRLSELLRKVWWAISREETRYYLNGVAWMWRNGRRRFVATDGHRLAACDYAEAAEGVNETFIIPTKAVALLAMIGGDMSVHRMSAALRLEVAAGTSIIRTRLIDVPNSGGYPDIDRVIPKPESRIASFTLSKSELAGAVDRTMVIRDGYAARVLFEPVDGLISVSARHPDLGMARAALRQEWPEKLKPFAVNGNYLRDIVGQCVGELQLHQCDPMGPLTILDEDETMTRLVMPMKV